jgi:hypothetical protein
MTNSIRPDTVGESTSKFYQYFFLRKFPKLFCLDNVIRAGLSGSFAPYPFSALAGYYDDGLIVAVIQSPRMAGWKR